MKVWIKIVAAFPISPLMSAVVLLMCVISPHDVCSCVVDVCNFSPDVCSCVVDVCTGSLIRCEVQFHPHSCGHTLATKPWIPVGPGQDQTTTVRLSSIFSPSVSCVLDLHQLTPTKTLWSMRQLLVYSCDRIKWFVSWKNTYVHTMKNLFIVYS